MRNWRPLLPRTPHSPLVLPPPVRRPFVRPFLRSFDGNDFFFPLSPSVPPLPPGRRLPSASARAVRLPVVRSSARPSVRPSERPSAAKMGGKRKAFYFIFFDVFNRRFIRPSVRLRPPSRPALPFLPSFLPLPSFFVSTTMSFRPLILWLVPSLAPRSFHSPCLRGIRIQSPPAPAFRPSSHPAAEAQQRPFVPFPRFAPGSGPAAADECGLLGKPTAVVAESFPNLPMPCIVRWSTFG